MMSISYGADENYITPNAAGAPVYENAKQIATAKRRLVSLYALNTSGSQVFVAVVDSPDAAVTIKSISVYPVPAGSFISIGVHGGERYETGIYVLACTDKTLGVAAGNVMFWKVGFTAYH